MNSKDLGRAILMVAIILVLILVADSTGVTAQEGGEDGQRPEETEQTQEERAETVSGGPGYISVNPIAFKQRTTEGELAYTNYYEIYNSSTTGILVVVAPVYLPQGAKVNKFTMYYYDSYPVGHVQAYLCRYPLSGGTALGYLASIPSNTNTGYANLSDSTIDIETIDNANYSYLIYIDFQYPAATTSLRATGFRIDYEYPSYLPTVMN